MPKLSAEEVDKLIADIVAEDDWSLADEEAYWDDYLNWFVADEPFDYDDWRDDGGEA